MKQRNTWVLLVILIFVVAVLVFLVRPPEREQTPEEEAAGLVFADIDLDTVTQIRIKTPRSESTLRREGDEWVVEEFDDFPADQTAVTQLLDMLREMKYGDMVSSNPENQQVFQVDESGTEVTLEGEGGEELAHFFVGKNGPDYVSTYFRMNGVDEVYLIRERLSTRVDRGTRTWRNRRLFEFEPEDVLAMNLAAGEEGVDIRVVADDDRNWKITSPEEVPADKSKVELVCRSFGRLSADDFPDTQGEELSSFGLDEPRWVYTAELADGSTQVLQVGSADESGNRLYVKRGDSPTVYLLGKYRISSLSKKVEDLKMAEEPTAADAESAPGSGAVLPPDAGADAAPNTGK